MEYPQCGTRMVESFRKEDDFSGQFVLRRIVHHAECLNPKCGVTITTVMPLMLKVKGKLK